MTDRILPNLMKPKPTSPGGSTNPKWNQENILRKPYNTIAEIQW